MREYLTALRAAVDDHPYAVPLHDAPPLNHVYLRQRGIRTDRSINNDEAVIFLPGPHRRGSSDSADSQELFIRHRNTLLMGRPGSGKSSLLRYIAGHSCTAWLEDAVGKFVPAYISAAALTSPDSFIDIIAKAVSREIGARIDAPIAPSLFTEEPMPGVPWLLLIDGMDEILEGRRRKSALDAIALRQSTGIFRFLVASRPLSNADIKGLPESGIATYEILPFSPDQLLILAQTWFRSMNMRDPDQKAEEFRRSLEQSRIAHIACVPLIASMLCLVFSENPEAGIPENRAGLYEEFIRVLMSKQYEHVNIFERLVNRAARYGSRAGAAVEELLEVGRSLIERLAFEWYKGEKCRSLDLLEKWTSQWRPRQMPAAEWRNVLEEMLRQSGLLVQRAGDFRFIHLTIQEYMAATHEARDILPETANSRVFNQKQEELSYRLFLAAICSRHGISFDVGALRLLEGGSAVNALFTAALNRDGVALSKQVMDSTVERLERISAIGASRAYSIDTRIQAAHELAFLDPERGQNALSRLVSDRHVAAYDRVQAARQLVDLDFVLGVRILRDQAGDFSIGGPERMLIAQHLLDLDPDIGISVLKELVRDHRMNGWTRLDIVDELLQWDSNAATDALVFLVQDPNLADYCRLEAYERLPYDVIWENALHIPYTWFGEIDYAFENDDASEIDDTSLGAFDQIRLLASDSKHSHQALTRLAELIVDPDFDSAAKEWALRIEFDAPTAEELIRPGVEIYDDACVRVFGSLGVESGDLDLPDRVRTARRLAVRLDRNHALATLVRLETVKRCDAGGASCQYWLAVATILMDISARMAGISKWKDARTSVNAALAIYRDCAAFGLNLEEDLTRARRLARDLRSSTPSSVNRRSA